MDWVRSTYRLGRNQLRNIGRIVVRRPVVLPPLGSVTLESDDLEAAKYWLENPSRWSEQGLVDRFESEFADWNGSRCAVSFADGRTSLTACIEALALQPGDEVIVPGYTCIVVPNAFWYRNIHVVFADIELDTYGMSVESLKRRLSPKTKAILVHHLYGLVSRDFQEVLDVARHEGIPIIEDCAQATGATYKGVKVGNFGDLAFYSSEQSKVFSTVRGGLAVTNRPEFADRLRAFQGAAPTPDHAEIAFQLRSQIKNYYWFKHPLRYIAGDLSNFRYGVKSITTTTADEVSGKQPPNYGRRMAAPIAALGSIQLSKIDRFNAERRRTVSRWDAWCSRQGYQHPLVIPESDPVWLRYPVCVTKEMKQNLSWAEASLGVRPGVWFATNLHPSNVPVNACPNADIAVDRCINLPTLLPGEGSRTELD